MPTGSDTGVQSAGEIVSSQFELAKSNAQSALAVANSTISSIGGGFSSGINTVSPSLPSVNVDQSFTVDPVISQVMNQIEGQLGNFETISPPGDSPAITDHNFPSDPSITWPTDPILKDIVIPDFQDGTIRELTSYLPVFDLEVPALDNTIQTALNDAIQPPSLSNLGLSQSAHDKLKSNIDNGGTMINSSVEADIWNRDLERNEQALQDAVDKVTSQWAKMGFSLPDGLLAGNLLAVNNEYMNKRLDRSREIAVKQAELEQSGMFKSLELATGFSHMWFGTLEAWRQRTFNVTKLTADTLIDIYKARVAQFNVQLEAFKADLLAWKTGIEREMVRVDVFKGKIAGQQLITSINESNVKIYTARLESVAQLIKVWDTQIRSVAVMYDVEKAKLEAYKTTVEAYSTRVDAATKKYTASMEGLKALIAGWSASADAKVKLIDLNSKAALFMADAELKSWEIQLKVKEQELALRLEGLKAAASAASNLAAGALSAAHANAQASYSSGISANYSY